jgi:hypothetical protein
MKRRTNALVLLAALAALTACGGGSAKKASATPTPSPTPTLPTLVVEKAAVKAAVVTALELGPGWIQPKDVSKVKGTVTKGKAFLCPGHETAYSQVPPRAHDGASFTLGAKAGAAIASFDVITYLPTQIDAWRTALSASQTACARWKAAEGNYDVLTPIQGVTLSGAEEVVAFLERVYADAAHKQLQYVRQVVTARAGRLIVAVERAYLTTKADPTGKDFTETTRLAGIQLQKAVGDVIQ